RDKPTPAGARISAICRLMRRERSPMRSRTELRPRVTLRVEARGSKLEDRGSKIMVKLKDIEDARARLGRSIYHSPCPLSLTLSRLSGCRTYFKLENLQMTGAFKERGALNKLMQLSEAEKKAGVIAASAGNHAQGVAYHATRLGIRSTIVMPRPTPLIKVANTRDLGGEVVLHGANYDEALAYARHTSAEKGMT